MTEEELIKYAQNADFDAVAAELRQAIFLASRDLYTESVMRFGRATEATLYAVGREFGVKLQLHIPQVSDLQSNLRGLEAKILKKSKSTDNVKKLSDISKQLSQTIAILMESESFREGTECDHPRGNDSILKELIAAIEHPESQQKLIATKQLLEKIMHERNAGAHASPTGELRETDPAIFPDLASEFQHFIRTVMEVAVGERGRRLQVLHGTLEDPNV